MQVYTMRHWDGQPEMEWKSEPTWREPLHADVLRGTGRAEGESAELSRAEQEKGKRQREAAAEGLGNLGDRRDRKDMLQKWAQRLRGKASPTYDVRSCFFRKLQNVRKRKFVVRRYLFFWFLRPENRRGGVPPTRALPKNIGNPEIWAIWGYFCLLWAGPAEQCCTPVYLPIEDFRQKFPFSVDFLARK